MEQINTGGYILSYSSQEIKLGNLTIPIDLSLSQKILIDINNDTNILVERQSKWDIIESVGDGTNAVANYTKDYLFDIKLTNVGILVVIEPVSNFDFLNYNGPWDTVSFQDGDSYYSVNI